MDLEKIEKESRMSPRIKKRNEWFKDLWEEVQSKHPDIEIARAVFKRLLFEEKY